jgi:hypothetical protein
MAAIHSSARTMTGTVHTTTSTVASPSPAAKPCHGEDPELFFPVAESRSALTATDGELAALAVCGRCPLAQRQECLTGQLQAGVAHQWGVSGGMTAAQRRHLLRGKRNAVLVAAQVVRQLGADVPGGASTAAVVLPLAG